MTGMHHPFISDLSDKSIEDLQEAISELTGKLTFAHRTQNQPLVNQLDMVMNS
jgi:ribosomal protein L29